MPSKKSGTEGAADAAEEQPAQVQGFSQQMGHRNRLGLV